MGNQLLASKIITKEEPPRLRNIPTLPTAVLSVEGVAERGPINSPVLCSSWDDYVKSFGSFIADGDLATVVYGIYLQDRSARIWVNRIVHYTDITDPATITSVAATATVTGTTATETAGAVTSANPGPWNLDHGQTLDIHCDEDVGGPDTATFNGVAATVTGGAVSLPVTIAHGFTVVTDTDPDDQVVTYSAGHATVEDVAEDINAQVQGMRAVVVGGATINFLSDTEGTDGSIQLKDEVGTGLSDIGHTAATTAGTGNVGNIDAVTFSEAKTIIEAAVVNPATGVTVSEETGGELTITSNTTGVSSSVMVEATSTATAFGFDNLLHSGAASGSTTVLTATGKSDGTYAHDLRVVVEDPTNGQVGYFNLKHTDDDGVVLEIFPNVQNTDEDGTDFVETVLNDTDTGSDYFTYVADSLTVAPDNGTYTPSGGDDGIVGIADTDWLGDSSSGLGLHAFNQKQDITLLLDGGRATAAWHLGMVTYCEVTRSGTMFAVLDPPEGLSHTEIVTYVTVTAALKNLTEYAAIYWPRLKIVNPSTTVFGSDSEITVPPSGIVAGVMSRVDNAKPGGIYTPPAGVENGVLRSVTGFENEDVFREEIRDIIYPERINPLTVEEGWPRCIDGVWTLKETGNFPSIAERRGVIYIERSIKNGLQPARHRNNDADLRAEARRSVFNFLLNQMRLGAFRTKDPTTAFFVDFSEALNTPAVINAFQLKGRVGLATQKPAEWVILTFTQDTRAIEEELAG